MVFSYFVIYCVFVCWCAALVFLLGTASGIALHVPLYTIGLQPSRRKQKSSVFHDVGLGEIQCSEKQPGRAV